MSIGPSILGEGVSQLADSRCSESSVHTEPEATSYSHLCTLQTEHTTFLPGDIVPGLQSLSFRDKERSWVHRKSRSDETCFRRGADEQKRSTEWMASLSRRPCPSKLRPGPFCDHPQNTAMPWSGLCRAALGTRGNLTFLVCRR